MLYAFSSPGNLFKQLCVNAVKDCRVAICWGYCAARDLNTAARGRHFSWIESRARFVCVSLFFSNTCALAQNWVGRSSRGNSQSKGALVRICIKYKAWSHLVHFFIQSLWSGLLFFPSIDGWRVKESKCARSHTFIRTQPTQAEQKPSRPTYIKPVRRVWGCALESFINVHFICQSPR